MHAHAFCPYDPSSYSQTLHEPAHGPAHESKKENIFHIWIFPPVLNLGVTNSRGVLADLISCRKQTEFLPSDWQSQFQLGAGRPTGITLDLRGSTAASGKSVEV